MRCFTVFGQVGQVLQNFFRRLGAEPFAAVRLAYAFAVSADMLWRAMPSTVIRSFSYDDTTRQLRIVFQSGRPYVYEGVPKTIYESMQQAFSKGEFFNAHIRDHFSFVREPLP